MEIDKTLVLNAPPARVWALLLDPQAMGACVPGMESIEVISDDEYVALMKVKISFISARFKLKTRIVERDEPRYLRAEGTGEDASVASSLKQTSEMWLAPRDDGSTELRMKVKVDVLGRMGTFGLSVMKTKADRMWDEFGVNAENTLAPAPADLADRSADAPAGTTPATGATSPVPPPAPTSTLPPVPAPAHVVNGTGGFWSRVFGAAPSAQHIRIDLQRGDTRITVHWPVSGGQECAAWLRDLVR